MLGEGVPSPTAPIDDPLLASLKGVDDRWRWLVGYAVSECAALDYLTSDLVEEVLVLPNATGVRYWGKQGRQLKQGIDAAAEIAAQRQRARLTEFAVRYGALFEDRNHLVHGMFDGLDGEHVAATKLVIAKNGATHTDAEPRSFTERGLSDLIVEAIALSGAALWMLNELRNPDWPGYFGTPNR